MFVTPMLASPRRNDWKPEADWFAEEKFDGHRLCVQVERRTTPAKVMAWSRNEAVRLLPPHVRASLGQLPAGVYDGELISKAKHKSYGVTDLSQQDKLQFVMFDVLYVGDRSAMDCSYVERRQLMREIERSLPVSEGLSFAKSVPVGTNEEINKIAQSVWNRGGEGLVIKQGSSTYVPKKRSKLWIKVKQCHTAVLSVVGYVAGRMGPYATVLLEDQDGNQTRVKTRNGKALAAFAADPDSFIGRKLRIEYQERTPDGSYRHPMWDRWEDE